MKTNRLLFVVDNSFSQLIIDNFDDTRENLASTAKSHRQHLAARLSKALVVYVIYVSLVYTDSKKTASRLLPRHTIFATFGRQLKCLLVRIQGGLYLFHYVLDNLNWLLFVFLSNLIINLMYNIKKLYF